MHCTCVDLCDPAEKMEDPLHDRKKRKNFIAQRMHREDRKKDGSELANMFRQGAAYERREQDDREIKRQRELGEYIELSLREKEAQKKLEANYAESDSDSVEEDNQKKERKKRIKKRTSEVKTLRRKRAWTPNCMDTRKNTTEEEQHEDPTENFVYPMEREEHQHQKKKYKKDDPQEEQEEQEKQPIVFQSAKEEQDAESYLRQPLQKLFYVEPNETADKRDDEEEFVNNAFENVIHSLQYTDKDMSMVMNTLKVQGRVVHMGSRRNLWETVIASMDIHPRSEEDAFLRTKRAGERDCCYGDACEGRKVDGGEILVEHLSENDLSVFHKTHKLPAVVGICLMCKRYIVAYMYINTRAECGSIPGDSMLCNFYNLIGKGEYALEQCIMSGTMEYQGLPAPVVLHCRRYYKKRVVEGDATYFLQQGYIRPDDVVSEKQNQIF